MTNKIKLSKEISSKIIELIDNSVKMNTENEHKYENFYKEIVATLEDDLQQTENGLKNYKEDNFTSLSIELEGYRRCLIYTLAMFKQKEEWMIEENS